MYTEEELRRLEYERSNAWIDVLKGAGLIFGTAMLLYVLAAGFGALGL